MEWSMIPACPSLMCFFNRGNTEGTNSSESLCLMCVYVLLCMKICVRTDFVVFGEFMVWWLVWRVNRRQIEVCFSPDVILCGWLGSKYQLTNSVVFVLICLKNKIWLMLYAECCGLSPAWVLRWVPATLTTLLHHICAFVFGISTVCGIEEEDSLENLHILSCFVWLRSVLFNLSACFWLFFF